MIEYLLNLAIGYLIGSIPSAYLLVKRKTQLDIRDVGSGNVGARNAIEVTGSKTLGFIILLIDVSKGILAVWLSSIFFGKNFWINGISGIGAVLGHDYPVWIKFKGGRGLATTAGVMLLLGWFYVIIWLIFYFLLNAIVKHIHIATVFASIITPIAILSATETLRSSILLSNIEHVDIVLLSSIFSILIILKNIKPIVDHINNKKLLKDEQK